MVTCREDKRKENAHSLSLRERSIEKEREVGDTNRKDQRKEAKRRRRE